ncbi:hypothetical protein [Streptomyces sp. GbtcB6]|uniref:hypothetical protein n=1 Tax=Streptomyces sp. GbtcB6 TaxID=2824751 RepID=UPI001C2F9C50|nr:hypothetical protein [Streptomyces sp. GbtcB6]
MTKPSQPWTMSLEDSVFALGAAARECQAAARAATITTGQYDLDRLRLLDGKVKRRRTAYTGEQEPHLAALSRIGQVQLQTKHQLERVYEEAARAYAHGANWSVLAVRAGEQPAHVVLTVDDVDDSYDFDAYMPKLDFAFSGSAQLEAARRAYERCIVAGYEAEGIGRQEYVSDHEAGEMHAALDVAAGLSDAAYAYGVLAEGALRWTLTNSVNRQ